MNFLLPLLLALATQSPATPAPEAEAAPAPAKSQAEVEMEAYLDEGEAAPIVAVRVEKNGDRVEEYSRNGKIYMVKVTPGQGPAYYLMDTDQNGKLNRDDRDPRVQPVHWTVYEWD